jgi:hypothetical protein
VYEKCIVFCPFFNYLKNRTTYESSSYIKYACLISVYDVYSKRFNRGKHTASYEMCTEGKVPVITVQLFAKQE